MEKVQKIDFPLLENSHDEMSEVYKPILNDEMLTSREAIARINRRLIKQQNRIITPDAFYHRVARGKVRAVKVRSRYYYHPYDIDRLQFSPNSGVAVPQPQPRKVHTVEELRDLAREYGPLVDIEGMIEALYKKTGHRYTPGAIKQRLHRKTIWYVAYTGSDKRKEHWFPVSQIEYMILQPLRNIERSKIRKKELSRIDENLTE